MVKYAKSLYWASFDCLWNWSCYFSYALSKIMKIDLYWNGIDFIVMLLKELRDYRKHHSKTAKIIQMKLNETHWLIKVFDWNWCRACDWTWIEYACYWRHHCNLRWHRPYARDLESVTHRPCSPTLFDLLFGKLVERARSFVPGP